MTELMQLTDEAAVFEPRKSDANTLRYAKQKCVGCGACTNVCPHAVFRMNGGKVDMVAHGSCMECGACMRNCPSGAIIVNPSVGCAAAMFRAALTGKDISCDDLECCD
ncbi:MAG TPA: mercury methylation ferredoxin HgcB [Methanomassiliicoccales archaeon]|nr:mercury methylation ferredoxin HgcB [Methanomassiliicoccales archaeon]